MDRRELSWDGPHDESEHCRGLIRELGDCREVFGFQLRRREDADARIGGGGERGEFRRERERFTDGGERTILMGGVREMERRDEEIDAAEHEVVATKSEKVKRAIRDVAAKVQDSAPAGCLAESRS